MEIKNPAHAEHLASFCLNFELVNALLPLPDPIIRDKDRPIMEAAAAARCSHLLTSVRRDFGPFFGKTIAGVKVMSPQMMAEEMGLKQRRD